jgi:hypothetical protein
MRLGLSSAAAPDAGLDELLAACTLRGLSTLELRAGDAHGIAVAGDWSAAVSAGLAAAAEARVTIAGYRTIAAEVALRYIRFIGGGPEAALQEGRGIGTLMGRLALAGYNGAVILAPSATRYRVAWESWLGRRGGWGCGSKSAAAELVHLPVRTATGGRT